MGRPGSCICSRKEVLRRAAHGHVGPSPLTLRCPALGDAPALATASGQRPDLWGTALAEHPEFAVCLVYKNLSLSREERALGWRRGTQEQEACPHPRPQPGRRLWFHRHGHRWALSFQPGHGISNYFSSNFQGGAIPGWPASSCHQE